MTVTPAQLMIWPSSHVGMPYAADDQRLLTDSPTTDCSGMVYRDLESCGIDPGENDVSETLQTWAQSSGGALISVDQAIRTEGAGLFHWGAGPDGHVALSRGDGTTWETPAWGPYGHALGIGNAYGRDWTAGCLWPDVDYTGHQETPGQYPPLTRLLKPGCAGADVQECQFRLLFWSIASHNALLGPGPIDGMFGPLTEVAVRVFQTRMRITVDGIVGPQTWAALWSR
jgi:peptidoglycan hydrolase-like protein with peptidoglycan-binding domain